MSRLPEHLQETSVTNLASDPFCVYASSAAVEGTPFLKFDRGTFKFGIADEKLPLGMPLVPNMAELKVGWLKWHDGQVVDEAMVRLADGHKIPSRDAVGDTDKMLWETNEHGNPIDPWQFTNLLPFKNPAMGAEFVFTTSSRGGLQAVGKLCNQYGNQRQNHPGELPIVEIGSDCYKHKTYGDVHFPVFTIVQWRAEASLIAGKKEAAAFDFDDDIDF